MYSNERRRWPLPQQGKHLIQRESFLHRHHGQSLLWHGVVEAHGEVALTLVEKTFHPRDDSHGADGDALGAPAETPVGGEDLRGSKDGIEVVHRFAHAHKDHVGQLLELGNGEELVEDVASREVAVKALLSGDTETAAHLAAHLTGDAEGGAVIVGDEDRLDEVAVEHRKEVFLGAVLGNLAAYRVFAADVGYLAQAGTLRFREVGHRVNGVDSFLVEPVA